MERDNARSLTERRASAPITLGQQPEALAVLETAARQRGMRPRDQGLEAKPDTAPIRENSAVKNSMATRILHENAVADTGKATTAAPEEAP